MSNDKYTAGITNSRLFKRAAPDVNSERIGIWEKGQKVKILSKTKGSSFEGTEDWYELEGGIYSWAGGIIAENNKIEPDIKEKIDDTTEQAKPINGLIDYRKLLTVNGDLGNKDGVEVKIAMLDSGVFINHPDFNKNRIRFPELYNSFDEIVDKCGHGTHLTGIICGNSPDESGIVGIAPNSMVYHYKAINDDKITNFENVKKSLQHILINHEYFDIINMSLAITNAEYNQIEGILRKINEKGIIMVAAAGDNDYLHNRINYPAFSDYIISIGAIENEYLNKFKNSGFYKKVDFFYLNNRVSSTFIKPLFYKDEAGCSVYTAFTSGIIAKLISSEDSIKTERFKNIRLKLDRIAHSYSNINKLEKYKLYKTP